MVKKELLIILKGTRKLDKSLYYNKKTFVDDGKSVLFKYVKLVIDIINSINNNNATCVVIIKKEIKQLMSKEDANTSKYFTLSHCYKIINEYARRHKFK